MIKSGRGSLKVGVVAKIFARFAHKKTLDLSLQDDQQMSP